MPEDIYQVETEERTYNSVKGVSHFIHAVRVNWRDWSAIQHVWKWDTDNHEWVEINSMEWVETTP